MSTRNHLPPGATRARCFEMGLACWASLLFRSFRRGTAIFRRPRCVHKNPNPVITAKLFSKIGILSEPICPKCVLTDHVRNLLQSLTCAGRNQAHMLNTCALPTKTNFDQSLRDKMSCYIVGYNFHCALDKRKYLKAIGMFWTFWSRGQSREKKHLRSYVTH